MLKEYDENLLLGYVEDDLGTADRAKVVGWLSGDPQLARLLKQMRGDREALIRIPDPHAPLWVMDEIDRQLERTMLIDAPVVVGGSGDRCWWATGPAALSMGMAAVLAVVAGVVVWSLMSVSGGVVPQRDGKGTMAQRPAAPAEAPASKPEPTSAVTGNTEPPRTTFLAPPAVPRTGQPDVVSRSVPGAPDDVAPADKAVTAARLPWTLDLQAVSKPGPSRSKRVTGEVIASSPAGEGPDASSKPHARPGGALPKEMLTVPKELIEPPMSEVKDADAMKALLAEIAVWPKLMDGCRVEVVTRDGGRTRARLAELCEPGGGDAAVPHLRVAPEHLSAAMDSLKAEPSHASVRLLRPATVGPSPVNGQAPDYARILAEQLPSDARMPREVATVSIPVVIRESRK